MDATTLKYIQNKAAKGEKLENKIESLNKRIRLLSDSEKGEMNIGFSCPGSNGGCDVNHVMSERNIYVTFRIIVLEELQKYRDEIAAEFEAL